MSLVDNGSWHVRGMGASAALKYKGFDGSYAFAKLSPHNFVNQTQQNTDALAPNIRYGQKAAIMNSFELGYTFNFMGKDLGLSGEYATSKAFYSDASKASIKGFRVAHRLSDSITMHALLQEHASKGHLTYDNDGQYNVTIKNKKIAIMGFSMVI